MGEAPDKSGDDQHQRGVVTHVLVDDPHEGQLGLFGGQDQVADAAQGGVFAGLADLDLEEAVHVDGTGKDRFAHALVDRERFTGDVGLIDGALSGDDLAVGGDVVAWADADDVSDLEFAHGHFDFVSAGQPTGLGRGELDERLDGSPGTGGRASFDDFTQQHEEGDDAGGLESACEARALAFHAVIARDRAGQDA